jgi:hypothetical protein
VHGLHAGREPSAWVIALYCLCLVAVGGAFALRTAPLPIKRQVARRILELLDPAPRGRRAAHQESPRRDRREAPLPGMDRVDRMERVGRRGKMGPMERLERTEADGFPAPGQAAVDGSVPPEWPGHPPPRSRPQEHWFTPPAPPLYEATPHPPVDPPPSTDMTAAYRALSTAPSRWPTPSPPPPAYAPSPPPPAHAPYTGPYSDQAPPAHPPHAYDPLETGAVPTVPAAPVPYDSSTPHATHEPPAHPPPCPGPTGRPGTHEEPAAHTPAHDTHAGTHTGSHPDRPFGAPSSGEPWSASGSTGGQC